MIAGNKAGYIKTRMPEKNDATYPVFILAGPTASGKSARALEIARTRGGVIINADSLQIYDALPILTARPSAGEMAEIPHCLYGALPPAAICSAGVWRDLAMREIAAAHEAGKLPILCGGTGFYLKALKDGLSPIPDVPAAIRARACALREEIGNPAFYAQLCAKDPHSAARIAPTDSQRMIRAFEVLEHTGHSLSFWQAQPRQGPPPEWRFTVEILMPERAELYRRCDARFAAMMEAGALDEVAEFAEKLKAGVFPEGCPPTQALGFAPLRAHLCGNLSRHEAVDLARQETRQYAKRQCTWLRHQMAE